MLECIIYLMHLKQWACLNANAFATEQQQRNKRQSFKLWSWLSDLTIVSLCISVAPIEMEKVCSGCGNVHPSSSSSNSSTCFLSSHAGHSFPISFSRLLEVSLFLKQFFYLLNLNILFLIWFDLFFFD